MPTATLTVGGTSYINYLRRLTVNDALTNQVPSFSLELVLPPGEAVAWNQAVVAAVNGETILKGRVDDPSRPVSKDEGSLLVLTGRGDAGALQDIETSLHLVDMAPNDIADALLAEYSNRRQANDPNITWASGGNLAPNAPNMTFQWKGKSIWKCYQDLSDALGAPSPFGVNKFYDFYVDGSDKFRIFESGSVLSGISINANTETIKKDPHIDSLPVKNDLWIWGASNCGAVPLEMQPGYNGNGITDPWTESNAAQYDGWASDDTVTIANDAVHYVVGTHSIEISLVLGAGSTQLRAYWYMNFAHGGKMHTKLAGFTNQLPNDCLNTYNETTMNEFMGEIQGISYYLRAIYDFNHYIEAVDSANRIIRSNAIYKPAAGTSDWFNPEWVNFVWPFGPSASDFIVISNDGKDTFDWSSVKQLRFVMADHSGPLDVWFDGFAFIKPLVVNRTYTVDATTRTARIAKDVITTYNQARTYGDALLENMKYPQTYCIFQGIGRADIPIGSKFIVAATTYVLREAEYTYDKTDGWKVQQTGWELT